jgi:GWxTD domain-containing protein
MTRSSRSGPTSRGRPRVSRLRRWSHGALLGLGLLATAAFAVRGQEPAGSSGLEATLVRSWAGDGVTLVDGLVHVPLGMLAAATTGAYRFELLVSDAEGNALFRDSWIREVSGRAAAYVGADASYMLESFSFGLRSGAYEVEIRAYPTDAADLGVRESIALEAFADRPIASDLILSTRVQPLDESGGGSWSVSRGGFGIRAAARTVILANEPNLYYYIELYGDEAESTVSAGAEIRNAAGASLFRTPNSVVTVTPGGRPFTGRLPLAGLPAGEYELVMTLESEGAGSLVRAAPFELRESAPRDLVASSGGSELEEYFGSLSDKELAETFGGIGALVTEAERRTYEALPPDAKRRYLVDFFSRRDPNPAVAGNRFLDEYLERISVIRSRYGERVGTGERMPWTTDMGKVYLAYGEPMNRIVNHNPADEGQPTAVAGAGGFGGEPPYEIWQYQSTGFVYLFIEENRFDAWRLVFTTDPKIQSLADWRRRIGPSAARDLTSNFGIVPDL